ncbi:protein of unknown function [Sterolibacterium denitrificans]|uniref:Uncharacterized protein n=1 Tax=Sterolibacterium denitrificans TaxID=157592 RepID=A0A7Z7MV87_9PROT|nr:hypothetical protein [Sterolibacterium denitrificans]SMB26012.1 protein of unknown function [Sterolibacterium denitrificans]
MDKPMTQALARFCVDQSDCFNARDWLRLVEIDTRVVALAAKYLSMTSWYGHEDDLAEIAERLYDFDDDSAALYRESRMLDFDLPYFSSAVRFGIARSHGLVAADTDTRGKLAMLRRTGRSRRRFDGVAAG